MSKPLLKLASASPRRRQLLEMLDVPFEVVPADIDELAYSRPALGKARAVAQRGSVTLAADTMIELNGERIGKPRDASDASAMLARLAGREHVVRSDVAVVDAAGRQVGFGVRSRVRLRDIDSDTIERYVASGEPLDKAGAYAIQGAGAALVERYDGCYANIVGLPICHTYYALRKAGVVTRELPEPAFARALGFACPAAPLAQAQGRILRDGAEFETARSR